MVQRDNAVRQHLQTKVTELPPAIHSKIGSSRTHSALQQLIFQECLKPAGGPRAGKAAATR